jgi:peptide/nickel transport system permease protein
MSYLKNIKIIINKFSFPGYTGISIIFIVLLLAVFSNYLSIYPHDIPSGASLEAPGLAHWLGTDDLGIDIWAQICFGAGISIIIGFGTAFFAGIGGSIAGLFSGYIGGFTDKIFMRITDIMIALPDLPVMILLGAFFGPDIKNIIIVLTLFSWTNPARVIRSKILSLKHENYITAAKSYGAGFLHLTFRHFLPVILPLIMVSFIRVLNRAIVVEASLAFLGLGNPVSKSWGLILNHAINFKGIYLTDYWKWWVVTPAAAIMLLVISSAFIVRDIEKIVDTKL